MYHSFCIHSVDGHLRCFHILKVKVKVTHSCPTLCDPMDYTVHRILQVRIPEWVVFPFSRDLSNPGVEFRSPALQANSLPAEPQGKLKNTGVGSLSLFQQIFPTQESNPGLPHSRQALYGLSHKSANIKPALLFFFFLTTILFYF